MSRPSTLAVLLVSALTMAGRAQAQGPAPTLTVRGQAATFAPAVALLDEPSAHLSLLFPASALTPAADAAARAKGAWDEAARTAAPAVIVDLDFTPGSTSGMVAQLKGCRIRAVGFKAPWQVNGGAAACHIVSVGGLLKPTGGAGGLFEGSGDGYALRLPFFVTVPAAGSVTTPTPTPTSAAAAGSAPASAAVSVPVVPLNTAAGTATYMGQTLTVTHALAWWAAEQQQVRLALFDHAPPAGILADLRKGESGEGGPIADVYVQFAAGAARDVASVDYCYVNVTFPKGGPMGTNTNAKGCGLSAVTTDARPGGTILLVLKNRTRGPAADFTWDFRLHVPIAK